VPGGVASLTRLDHGITAVDTEYERPLHDASHLVVEHGRAAFIDTGVNRSVPLLLDALARLGLEPGDVDYVFLTHIHLDHAGGAGSLMRELPNAHAVLHPRGARHMVDPSRLVAGTEAVYGKAKAREAYGEIVPIPEARIRIANDGDRFELGGRPLQALHTEGHARHHYVLSDPASRGVFTGDSFGVSYRELDTANGEIVFPTTTPVHFDPEAAHAAVDRILSLHPERLYLTHYSQVAEPERLGLQMHAGIDAYVAIAVAHEGLPDRSERIRAGLRQYFEARLDEHGYDGGRAAVDAVLGMDVELNAQGLEFWLDGRKDRKH